MPPRQSGLSLIAVAIGMAALAAAAMLALYAIQHEGRGLPAVPALPSLPGDARAGAGLAPPASAEALRKCTIDGKTVISNTDCGQRGQVIRIHDSKGIEAPKAPPAPPAATGDVRARMIEKATNQ